MFNGETIKLPLSIKQCPLNAFFRNMRLCCRSSNDIFFVNTFNVVMERDLPSSVGLDSRIPFLLRIQRRCCMFLLRSIFYGLDVEMESV